MAKPLSVVKTAEQKPKPKRERIELIETKPHDDWFVRTTTTRGKVVWYLRFEVTGMLPRFFGPFASKWQCLCFLDNAINALADFEGSVYDSCEKRMVREQCQKVWPPIIEYPLIHQLHLRAKKGR